ncbi:MAG: RNA pseudouridine synthase, partial [Nitrospira sp.]|nr:RNA pseudouridine synthase [Nitrospira sp.]
MFQFETRIIFEDSQLIAVHKPPGLPVIPGRWNRQEPTLLQEVGRYLATQSATSKGASPENPKVIHRIDRDTSGVVVFAKTATAHSWLCQQFLRREVRKTYLGVVEGVIKDAGGTVQLLIGPHPREKGVMQINPRGGREAVTDYEVIERFVGFSLIKLYPKTGRTHQIRVHLQAIGHPLAVDPIYGNRSALYLSQLKKNFKPKLHEPERP